jgi:VanZ family protein
LNKPNPRLSQSLTRIKLSHYRWLFWGFLLCISYKLLIPAEHSGVNIPHLDKLVHGGIFFVMTFLLMLAYQMYHLQYFIVLTSYGVITEYLQAQTGYRTGDIFDLLADICGIILLFAVRKLWLNKQLKATNSRQK